MNVFLLLATASIILTLQSTNASRIGNEWPWPHPSEMEAFDIPNLEIVPATFKIVANVNCTVTNEAIKRYQRLIFLTFCAKKSVVSSRRILSQLEISIVKSTCEQYPSADRDESYELEVNSPAMPLRAQIRASTEWGALRALETFSQLIVSTSTGSFSVKSAMIADRPRFAHRGLMIDTSRHFITVPVLKSTLDAMSYNKMNVFHWHLTDNEYFPYESIKFPSLSQEGAANSGSIYRRQDISDLINYAALRGIRVIPEFGTPAHMNSWGRGRPDVLTQCQISDKLVNVASTGLYQFLNDFFQEVSTTFPDKTWHFGGDEVNPTCWMENEKVRQFMAANNLADYEKLEEFYYQKLTALAHNKSKSFIFWEDPVGEDKNGLKLDASAIVQVWKPMADPVNWKPNMARIGSQGYKMLLSAPWYISHYPFPSNSVLKQYYDVEPLSFTSVPALKQLVIGGEAAVWTENIDSSNVTTITWPASAVIAERLWSPDWIVNWANMKERFQEQRCRLKLRGIDVGLISGSFDNTCVC